MKKLNFLLALILIGAVCFSCKKAEQEQIIKSTDRTEINNPALDLEKVNQRLNDHLASLRVYQKQLAQAGNSDFECMHRVVVPDDASSIQDAIEMVCDHGEVIVQSGTYAESIWISNKPGIHIRAVGDVTLNGDFSVANSSDNIIIEGFNIVLPDYPYMWDGIWLFHVSGCVIKNNSISNEAYPGINPYDNGITIREADNNQIKDNHIKEMDYGIWLVNVNSSCSHNMIMGNLVSHVGRGIYIRFDCDNNMIIGNQIDNSEGPPEKGISIIGADWDGNEYFPENNHVKLNQVTYCTHDGISMTLAFYNTIGPNNICNNNGWDGISLWRWSGDNLVINNEALNNGWYDIYNTGINNTFRANTAVNTFGL